MALVKEFPLWLFIAVCVAAVFVFSLCSCTEQKKYEKDSKVIVGRVDYNGHKYLVWRGIHNDHIDVEHDTDCECWKIDD